MVSRFAGLLVLVGCSDGVAPPDGPASPWSSIAFPDEVGRPGTPRRRLEPGVTALGTHLVVAGGFSTSFREGLVITDEVISLDTLTGTWEDLPSLADVNGPVRRDHGALVGVGGVLFMLGGFDDANANARGDSFVLELGAPAWTPLPAMPAGLERGAAGIVITPPHILLLGGSNSSGPLASALDFDLITRTWSRLGCGPGLTDCATQIDLPTPRSHPAAMKDRDGSLFIAGGFDDANRPLGDVFRLCERTTTPCTIPTIGTDLTRWELREPMTSRGGCAYATGFNSLWCAGGLAFSDALGITERYDPIQNVWTGQLDASGAPIPALPDLPLPRAGTQGAMIGGHFYVPGGSASIMYEPTDTVFVFSAVDSL